MLHAVIMAGGKGERFWPLSRERRPKQFLRLVGKKTMLAATADRLRPLVPPGRTWVITNRLQLAGTKKLLPRLASEKIVAEPAGRNTAPCAVLAAFLVSREDPEAVMALLPADHLIAPKSKFQATIRAAGEVVKNGGLATIGIKPSYPATGYGYIKAGKEIRRRSGTVFHRVERFVEKPPPARARSFLRSGKYYWNSGIFVWSAAAFLESAGKHLPLIYRKLLPAAKLGKTRLKKFLDEVYPKLPSISIDHGIMEKTRQALVAPAGFDWDDIGSWEAAGQYLAASGNGNRFRGKVAAVDTADCVAFTSGPLIGLVGMRDLIVVASEDAVLVCPRARSQEVKDLLAEMKKDKSLRGYF